MASSRQKNLKRKREERPAKSTKKARLEAVTAIPAPSLSLLTQVSERIDHVKADAIATFEKTLPSHFSDYLRSAQLGYLKIISELEQQFCENPVRNISEEMRRKVESLEAEKKALKEALEKALKKPLPATTRSNTLPNLSFFQSRTQTSLSESAAAPSPAVVKNEVVASEPADDRWMDAAFQF